VWVPLPVCVLLRIPSVLWPLFVQSLTAFLATPTEVPQAGSGPMNGHSDPNFSSSLAVSLPHNPAAISIQLCCAWPAALGTDGNLKPILS
jgi:hypothetical protein